MRFCKQKMVFEHQYLDPEDKRKEKERARDRFQVEFTEEERELWLEGAKWIQHYLDSTVLKQWAFYGMLNKIQPLKAESFLREKLLINQKNNIRNGRNIEVELKNKIHTKKL